jgi:DNA-binding transcriptional LysR family regulator
MELRQLKTFLTVGRLLSFYRAADVLHYAQSTVSAQIRALEEEFGVPLFDRLGRKVALTTAGEALMQYAERMLAIEEETRAGVTAGTEPQGRISLRVPETVATWLLPGAFAAFHRSWPGIGLDIGNCAFHTLKQEFRSGVTDLAFLIADSIAAAELVVEAIGFLRLVAVCAPGHPCARSADFALGELAGQTLLLPKQDCSYRMDIDRELAGQDIRLQARMEMTSVATIKQCTVQGMGVSILPEVAVREELREGRLQLLQWQDGESRDLAVLMLWHKDKWISPALAALMDAARACSGALAGGR